MSKGEEKIEGIVKTYVLKEMLNAWKHGLGIRIFEVEKDTDVFIAFIPLGDDCMSGKN